MRVELRVADNGIGTDELIFTNGNRPFEPPPNVWKPLLEQCDLDL